MCLIWIFEKPVRFSRSRRWCEAIKDYAFALFFHFDRQCGVNIEKSESDWNEIWLRHRHTNIHHRWCEWHKWSPSVAFLVRLSTRETKRRQFCAKTCSFNRAELRFYAIIKLLANHSVRHLIFNGTVKWNANVIFHFISVKLSAVLKSAAFCHFPLRTNCTTVNLKTASASAACIHAARKK